MEATMLAHSSSFARKRRAVEFHALLRSPRDMLLSLPIVEGEVVPLGGKRAAQTGKEG